DPDRSVLEGVDSVFVRLHLGVDATVQPGRVVVATCGGSLRVVHSGLDVVVGVLERLDALDLGARTTGGVRRVLRLGEDQRRDQQRNDRNTGDDGRDDADLLRATLLRLLALVRFDLLGAL